MRTILLSIGIISILFHGCASNLTVAELEEKYGLHSPVIKSHFASDTARNGDIWRVYFSAYDPDGDMEFIATTIDQTGVVYEPELIAINKNNREAVTGYVYLHIPVAGIWFQKITLALSILDKANHKSDTVFFPLHISNKRVKLLPPEFGEDFENPLGWIPTRLTSPHYEYYDSEINGGPPRGILLR